MFAAHVSRLTDSAAHGLVGDSSINGGKEEKSEREGRTGERSEPEEKMRRGKERLSHYSTRELFILIGKPARVPYMTRVSQRRNFPPTALYHRRLAWSLFLGSLKLSIGGSAGDLPIRELTWVRILVRFQLHARLLSMLNHHRSSGGLCCWYPTVPVRGQRYRAPFHPQLCHVVKWPRSLVVKIRFFYSFLSIYFSSYECYSAYFHFH